MARLLADESFPLPVVHEVRRLGHEVLTLQEAGRANQRFADGDVLALATADRRALATLNRKHFVRLHRDGTRHAGIIACGFDPDSAAMAARISSPAIAALPELAGELIRVNRPQ